MIYPDHNYVIIDGYTEPGNNQQRFVLNMSSFKYRILENVKSPDRHSTVYTIRFGDRDRGQASYVGCRMFGTLKYVMLGVVCWTLGYRVT